MVQPVLVCRTSSVTAKVPEICLCVFLTKADTHHYLNAFWVRDKGRASGSWIVVIALPVAQLSCFGLMVLNYTVWRCWIVA